MSAGMGVKLRLDVDMMRHAVVNALVDRHGEIAKAVDAEIRGLITSGHLERQIEAAVRRHLDAAIDSAVKDAMVSWSRSSPTVKQAIQGALSRALETAEDAL